MDVHRLGYSGGDPGDPGPILPARLAQGRPLAPGRRARAPWSRNCEREKEQHKGGQHHEGLLDALGEAFRHPKVLLLAAAYFFVVTSSYGVEIFLPKILKKWYELTLSELTWAVLVPPLGGLVGTAPGRLELGPHRRASAAWLDPDLSGGRWRCVARC